MSASKLALGTAQFGQPDGIANSSGQVTLEVAGDITKIARNAGIDTLDTAIAYGNSESCLGDLGVQDFKVVTKLPPIPEKCCDALDWIEQRVDESCERLKVDTLYGLLLHRSEDLAGPHQGAIVDAFSTLKRKRIVRKTGVSIYSPDELRSLVSTQSIDLVQAPLNLVDRRLVTTGWLDRLHEAGIEVHARSAFLQGLLLMPPKSIPSSFSRWHGLFQRWHDFLQESRLAPSLACLSYPLSLSSISRVVVGVDNEEQLRELIASAENPYIPMKWPDIDSLDEDLINPSRWRLN